MILNKHRLRLAVAIALLGVIGASCVDIPSSAPQGSPDYKSSVRFINNVVGVDTIAYSFRKGSDSTYSNTKVTTWTGTDSVRITTTVIRLSKTESYRRYRVNYSQPLNVYIDDKLSDAISFGNATTFKSMPAGGRKIAIKGSGTLVDSILVIKTDSTIKIVRDTVGKGSSKFDTLKKVTDYKFGNLSGTANLTLDSTVLAFDTEWELSVVLMFNQKALVSKESFNGSDLIRFFRVQYIPTYARQVFEPTSTLVDTAQVRFFNALRDSTLSFAITKGTPITVSPMALSNYSKVRAKIDTTYRFYLTYSNGTVFDSVSVPVKKTKKYAIAVIDSLGTRLFRTYNDN